jgi:hypothetical protein
MRETSASHDDGLSTSQSAGILACLMLATIARSPRVSAIGPGE